MDKVIIAEGRTTTEAINNGLKQLNTTKDNVTIKVLEDEKRMFFSILEPRKVRVEMTLKDEKKVENVDKTEIKRERKPIKLTAEEQDKARENLVEFLDKLIKN